MTDPGLQASPWQCKYWKSVGLFLSLKPDSVLQHREQKKKEKRKRNRCIKDAQMFLTQGAEVKSEILFQNLEKITFAMTCGVTFNS